ncbi:hypothetical protein K1719_011443 [Acacia pycnantha]|nr:hypothetical protein K1719_011443 [Acacia pycnantha]
MVYLASVNDGNLIMVKLVRLLLPPHYLPRIHVAVILSLRLFTPRCPCFSGAPNPDSLISASRTLSTSGKFVCQSTKKQSSRLLSCY